MHANPRPMRMKRGRLRLPSLALVLSASAAAAGAQTSSPQTNAAAEDETIVMNAFTVNTQRDYGYRASNSISGTRTDTPIRDVPLNIQVFTRDLVDDLSIKNQIDLQAYNASLVNSGADRYSDNVIAQDYNRFLFRGFRQNWGLRDGVREYDPIDGQALERVEIVKGPAAALYGLSYPGGVQQSITKAVNFSRNFLNIRLTAGDQSDYRGTVDANVTGKLADSAFGLRFNGAHEKSRDIRAHSEGKVEFESLNAAWQITPNTVAEGLIEHGYREKPNGLGQQTNGNDGQGYFARPEPGATGNSASIPLQIFHPEIPWTWNWANESNMRSMETHLYRGAITHKFNDNFQVRGYAQYQTRWGEDANGWGANGDGGAASWEAGGGWIGEPFSANESIQSAYTYRDWTNQMRSYGVTGVYKLEVAETKHTFAFGTNVWTERFVSRSKKELDPTYLVYPVRADIPTDVPFAPPSDLADVTTGNGWTHENNSNDYYFVSWQMAAFNDRLHTNVGLNRTNIKLLQWANGQATVPNRTELSQTSPMYGVVYDITPEFSIFGVYATSLFPDSGKDSRAIRQFAPIVGKSVEAGFKFELADGKVSGTVSAYQITQTGGSQNDPLAENVQTDVWDSLTSQQRIDRWGAGADSVTFRNTLRGDLVNAGEQESKGYEADLVFQPLRSWQVVLSYAYNNQEVTEVAADASVALRRTIGQSTPHHVKHRYALLTKYTFDQGPVKGLFVGMGLSAGSKKLIDYVDWNGAFVPRYQPSATLVEVFGGYRFRALGRSMLVQLNVKNITEEPDYAGWRATGSANVLSTQRYEVPTEAVYRLTFGVDF